MRAAKPQALTLEALLTSPTGFDLTTASPLQRALARVADGRAIGNLLDDAEIERHFGCPRSSIGLVAPVLVCVIAGVRGGKSLMAACAAVKGSLTADLSALKQHEIARFAIIAPTVDVARATFRLLTGAVLASPLLSKLVVGKPALLGSTASKGSAKPTEDVLVIRRPDGRIVEIMVVAASRGATTVRGRWLVGFVLDEVAQFGSDANGAVVNAEDLLHAAQTRLVAGAQGWLISSPFGPQGLLFELHRDSFGKPSSDLVVIHAPTRALNPSFPAAKIEAIRKRTPDVAEREYDAKFLDADAAFFDGASIDRATRKEPLEMPPVAGAPYVAAWDAATRGNAWTVVIARNLAKSGEPARVEVAVAKQWIGSKVKPLDPDLVIGEIAATLRPYGVREIMCDSWSTDALGALAKRHGLSVREWTAATRADRMHEMYRGLGVLLSGGRIDLPPLAVVRNDLRLVRRRVTANSVRIELPTTADGRHADFCPSLVLVAFFAERTPARGGAARDGGAPAAKTWVDSWAAQVRPDSFSIF